MESSWAPHWGMRTPVLALALVAISACQTVPSVDPPEDPLVLRGEALFFEETFSGNGRTCGTCHRATDNFGLSGELVASLPDDDPLFIAETNDALAQNFENTRLIRQLQLIVENQDGFDDLANNFNMRGIPHTLAMRQSIASPAGPRTGWGGDGAPGDGSLRAFAVGAVIQHFPKSLNRIDGVDFRLPSDEELDALEAFQLSLGRQEDLSLPLALRGSIAQRGQELFMDRTQGKCNACHFNAGANGDPDIFGPGAGNLSFDTGVEVLPDQPADLTGEPVPPDDGFGVPGTGEFNVPPVVEAADTGPFFHNNSVDTIEGAVAFYNGDSFNDSAAGDLLVGATGSGIRLDATQVIAVAAFLRVINSLENIRSAQELLERAMRAGQPSSRTRTLLERAAADIEDGAQVLFGGNLHPAASRALRWALQSAREAVNSNGTSRVAHVREANEELEAARAEMIGS